MRSVIKRTSLLLVFALCASHAEDWPQFRGPSGQGYSQEHNVPLEWSESKGVTWKALVPGRGWSSPVVADGKVWLTTAVRGDPGEGGRALKVLAYDQETGKELVNTEVFQYSDMGQLNPKNSYASPTPILDGNRVYVHFGALGTAALSTAGDVIWTQRLRYESQHGGGGSPVLYRDLLIFSCDGFDTQFVVALDKNSGRIKWKTDRRPRGTQAYTTPLIIREGERDEVVSVGAFYTFAYDPMTGKPIWWVGYGQGFSNVPRPVYSNGLVYIATGFYEPLMLAVRAGGTGDVTDSGIVWTATRGVPLTSSPIVVGDEFYMVSDNGIASCMDAKTGRLYWQHRLGGNVSASPVFADGRIYFMNEDGQTTVIAPGKEFRLLATNQLGGATLASMAVSGGAVFIRTDRHLYRIDSAGPATQGP
jgi:outer membrane protein assembly factor BamB